MSEYRNKISSSHSLTLLTFGSPSVLISEVLLKVLGVLSGVFKPGLRGL